MMVKESDNNVIYLLGFRRCGIVPELVPATLENV
jgi:hypothetical protein